MVEDYHDSGTIFIYFLFDISQITKKLTDQHTIILILFKDFYISGLLKVISDRVTENL